MPEDNTKIDKLSEFEELFFDPTHSEFLYKNLPEIIQDHIPEDKFKLFCATRAEEIIEIELDTDILSSSSQFYLQICFEAFDYFKIENDALFSSLNQLLRVVVGYELQFNEQAIELITEVDAVLDYYLINRRSWLNTQVLPELEDHSTREIMIPSPIQQLATKRFNYAYRNGADRSMGTALSNILKVS